MSRAKILTRDEMVKKRKADRNASRTVVFTNGCFDILHAGHVRYLEASRSLGDELYIGINSDASAHALKGAGRPLNSEMDRAEVLAALAAVSAVTIFDEPTAAELVEAVRPDMYVKGGDYSEDPTSPAYPAEGEVVRKHGGEVSIIPFAAGYSTTGLVERIRGRGDGTGGR